MAKSPTPPGAGVTDNGLASILASALQGGGGTGSSSGSTLQELLQGTMLGLSGRQGLTNQSLIGIMPRWVRANPALFSAVRGGQVDPYLPTNDPSTWRVWTGSNPGLKVGHSTNATVAEAAPTLRGDNTEMVNSVSNQPFLWSEDKVAEAIKKFQAAGVTNVTDFDSMQKAWGGLVQRAGAMYSLSSGQRKVTPWDVLDLYKNEMTKAGTFGGGSGGGSTSPTTVTQRSRSVSTITNGDGWSVLQNTLSHMLGRDPTQQETRDFVSRMNHLAAKNPTITTSTTSGIGSGHQNTSSHTKSGFDSNDILQNAYQDAQSNQDYAETQAGTTYFNATLSALGAIGG